MKIEIEVYYKDPENSYTKTDADIQEIVENYGYADFYEEGTRDFYYLDQWTMEFKKFDLFRISANSIDIKVGVKTQEGFYLGYGVYKNH